MPEQMDAAVRCLYERKQGLSYPRGKRGLKGEWLPDDSEVCPFCLGIRKPPTAYPWALYHHCKSDRHVAALFGVDGHELRKALEEYESALVKA